jgi:phage terminase small subunit
MLTKKKKPKPEVLLTKNSHGIPFRYMPVVTAYVSSTHSLRSPYKAAIEAGYAPTSARDVARAVFRLPQVIKYINAYDREMEARCGVTKEKWLLELKTIGFSRITDFVDFGPGGVHLKPVDAVPYDSIPAISEVSEVVSEKSSNIKFKLHDKVQALVTLGKHLGYLGDTKSEPGGKGDGADQPLIGQAIILIPGKLEEEQWEELYKKRQLDGTLLQIPQNQNGG